MTVLSPVAKQKFFDNSGAPAVGYKLFTYAAGTTTKLSTYTDSSGGTPNANPIVMDYRGEAPIWIPPNVAYKYVFASPTDTDPPGAPIWTVDNIVNSQLVTLYGGVDTGIANAYVLNFTANFTSYTDGIVIYWIPANTNTTASTINVNGLGVVNINNIDGSSIGANSIQANQVCEILYKSGAFILINPATSLVSGSSAASLTGMTAAVNFFVAYGRVNNLAIVTYGSGTSLGTSNSTAMTLTTLPSIIRPKFSISAVAAGVVDNGVEGSGLLTVAPTGVVTFTASVTGSNFTAAGNKGISSRFSLVYPIL